MYRINARWAHAVLLLVCAALMGAAPGEERTPLDEYVAKPDPHYSYKLVNKIEGQGVTTYVLEMVSQKWLTSEEVDRPIWKHWLRITKPEEVKTSLGLLYISGGSNGGGPPGKIDPLTARLAKGSSSIVTELKMIPNQPLVFKGETRGRKEDALIAYTWDKFLRTGESKWPARLPMTKAAVRAMDTITSFCAGDEVGKIDVDKFVVCGGSKRGWTTWTTAAVDTRVVGIAPIVIDMLNIVPSFQHHWRAYGFWAPAVGDYQREKIMQWSGSPQYAKLMKIVEPFEYRSRLTMPKYIINATGDQFFLPDSSQFYYNELAGPKYLRYVPNADHGLGGTDVPLTLLAFYKAIIEKTKLPEYSWTVEDDNSIRLTTDQQPAAAKVWYATNPEARDFRVDTIGRAWKSKPAEEAGEGTYIGRVDKPEKGYRAFLVELTYRYPDFPPFKITSQVKVVPDVLPFEYKQPTPPVAEPAAAGE